MSQTNCSRTTNQNLFDLRSPGTTSTSGTTSGNTSGNNPRNNNRINVNLISQTTCNINIHVTAQEGNANATRDSPSGTRQQHQQQQQQQSGNDGQNNTGSAGNSSGRNYGIFSTMNSSYPLIHTNPGSPRQPNSVPLPSHALPAFGIPPPSFESVTSSQGADPAFFRQSSVSPHSHSPPPSFENSFMFDPLPSVDGAAQGFVDVPMVLPDYESLHHGPPPSYDSVFPS